jgi:thiopurine S-methyltransferase
LPHSGKSLDMVWLAVRGHAVVGSEISAVAVADFFGEQQHQHTDIVLESRGPFSVHRAGRYELLQGDALQLTPELLGPVQAAYDRAALVALPPAMRETYADRFAMLMPSGSRTLLVAFEYAQQVKAGPPFSVTPDEVVTLYDGLFKVDELERVDIIGESPKFAAAGLDVLFEVAYSLTRL